MPLPFLVALTAIALLFGGRFGARLALCSLALLWFASSGWGAHRLASWWEEAHPPTPLESLRGADAIVVLSGFMDAPGPRWPLDRPEYNAAVDRLLAGLELWRAGQAPLIVVSGGSGALRPRGLAPEAERAAAWLQAQGVPKDRILIEPASRNTHENAVRTAEIANAHAMKRLILVTSAWHMPRALGAFTRAGMAVEPYPVDHLSAYGAPDWWRGLMPSSAALETTTRVWHEAVGLLAYGLTQRL